MDKEKLTAKQECFINEYLKDFNATQAAIRAGYSKRRASEIGYQLLQKTTVKTSIDNLRSDIEQELRMQFHQDAIKAREVLREVLINPNSSDRDKIVAAKDLLDRAGFKSSNKIQTRHYEGHSVEISFINSGEL